MQPKTLLLAIAAGFQLSGALAQSAENQTTEVVDTADSSANATANAAANATANATADSDPAKMAPEVADELASISEALADMQEEIQSAEDSMASLGFSADKTVYDEFGNVIYRPMPKRPRNGALELWSQRGFHGHRVVYGAREDQCDTIETYTYGRTGHGKSARVIEDGVCCHLYTAPGCNGHSIVVAGDVAALRPYGMDNKVKSVKCSDCNKLYANSA